MKISYTVILQQINIIMNIFWLSKNPKRCARYMCDQHVVKMILEMFLERNIEAGTLVKRKDMAVIMSSAKDYELTAPEALKKRFKDVALDSKEAKYIEDCYEKKSMFGYEDGTFRPENDMSLESLISMMSDSESDKATRVRMWQYLTNENKGKRATYGDLIDVCIKTGYLRSKYSEVIPLEDGIIYQ